MTGAARQARRRALQVAALALAVLAAAASAGAQTAIDAEVAATAARLRDRALAESRARELVRSLTYEVGPRLAGSPGDRAAVEWGLRTLRELGFAAVRAEEVVVPHWVRGEGEGWILDPLPRQVVLAALGGSVGTPEEGLTAEVVAVESLEALEGIGRDRIEGKIVFFGKRMERTRDASGYGKAVRPRRDGPARAAALGAVGVLIRSAGTSDDRVAHTGATRYEEGVPKVPAAALSNPDADVLAARLEEAAVRGEPVRFRLRLTSRRLPDALSANVIGEIPGGEAAEEIVLLGCHLDSWDLGDGAVDDAAGCAVVIEAARLVGSLPEPPRRTLRVVLFANEEFGLSGARAYAESHAGEIRRHVIATESDLGADRVFRFSSRVAEAALPAVDAIAELLAPLGIARGDNEAFGGADLIPLRRAGMPVVTLQQDARRYFDVHHTVNDTLARVDAEAIAQNAAAYATFAYCAAASATDFGWFPAEERAAAP